ncbi:cupin domain-containing protein [Acidisoma cellulosilytica]|uniref:Cupin domain-containing protein n=1 Tax=Acidisoma cellulosilyticum TaxID=2802395 RepID=A0A963Z3N7_9PROT|nr:XRE family transcriptional regulator [Acidisoma cellulosilyticum]MCB8882187.1 cupin domain-containing protein [Acidisoma cellulosilyticum]
MSAATLTQTIGRTLAELRQSRGWTLKTLSEATGVSVPVLSKIENNQTGISFETAMKIMGSLSLSLDELTGDKREPALVSGRRAINPAGTALKIPSMGRSYELFATELRQKRMVPMITTVDVHSAEEWGPLSRHDGEEWMYVLDGSIELHTELYAPLTMKAGDSVYIDSGMGHAMVALNDAPARVLSVYAGTGAPFGMPHSDG